MTISSQRTYIKAYSKSHHSLIGIQTEIMKKLFCVLFLALIATTCAQSEDDDDEGAYDGDYEESREVSGSDDYGDYEGNGGESRDDSRFEPDSNREKRSIRVRRGHKSHGVVGPVYTHVKTDHHGNFKWGVKHKVGGGHGHGSHH